MAIKWSWAFGPETPAELRSMGWGVEETYTVSSSQEYTYTYTGSPARHSLVMDDNYTDVTVPVGCVAAEGWV